MKTCRIKREKASGARLLPWVCIIALILTGTVFSLTKHPQVRHETIKEVMRDAVLHESGKISLLGLKDVNPALISAIAVTVILLLAAACIRMFAIPKFRYVPGRFQLLLEQWVGWFDGLA